MNRPALQIALRVFLLVCLPALVTSVLLRLPWRQLDAFLSDPAGARITDSSGRLLAVMPGPGGSFQVRTPGRQLPAACRALFVRLEDARFRLHPGVDPAAVLRAALGRMTGRGARSGASTITMQLARMVVPHPRSPAGKVVEALNALRIESRLTKDRILGLYLDSVPFGRNVRGVGAAAWTYFGSDIEALGPAQMLALAIIPRNPVLYDPFTNPDRLISAAREIDRSERLGIAEPDIEAAVRGARSARPGTAAPHFARFVMRGLAAGSLGTPEGEVRTSLDLALNDSIQARVRYILDRYESARITNAAVVVLDNATGAVLGWVGSRDFEDREHSGQLDGVLIRRQSASTLKPFLYAQALESGWTAATLLPDVPMVFGSADEESYGPQNFDQRSHGVVRLRTALASSLNVPAVYTLSRVGLQGFLRTLRDLGFDLPVDADMRYGLGSAVGNAEVSLLELVRAFTVFPRGGTVPDLVVESGQIGESRRVFDAFPAWMICSILSDPSARATGFGTRTYFRADVPALFKSGTSSEFTNLWCVGATAQYTVGAWAGNFDGRAVINKTGSIVPTQIVADVLNRLSALHPAPAGRREFARPAGAVAGRICTVTGKAATPSCPSTRTEYFARWADVPDRCTYHAAGQAGRSLLRDALLPAGEQVRLLFPLSGQLFYLDQTTRAGQQAIPVLSVAREGLAVTVLYDGRRVASGVSLGSVSVPLAPGFHTIVVTTRAGSDRAGFEVR